MFRLYQIFGFSTFVSWIRNAFYADPWFYSAAHSSRVGYGFLTRQKQKWIFSFKT
jgi:hypothetical protein